MCCMQRISQSSIELEALLLPAFFFQEPGCSCDALDAVCLIRAFVVIVAWASEQVLDLGSKFRS